MSIKSEFDKIEKELTRKLLKEVTDLVFVEVVKNTPKVTGKLKRGWKKSLSSKQGLIENDVAYAGFVEFGSINRDGSRREAQNFTRNGIENAKRKFNK